ncbi:hypothetical protein MMC13_003950 [Lambiella insularis]|nr:hypothetical protein [Lambiella insularis]
MNDIAKTESEIIDGLAEAAESDERLEHLMRVVCERTATAAELEEWEQYKRAATHLVSLHSSKTSHVIAPVAVSIVPSKSSEHPQNLTPLPPSSAARPETSGRSTPWQMRTPEKASACHSERPRTPVRQTSNTLSVSGALKSPLFVTPHYATTIAPLGQAKRLIGEAELERMKQAIADNNICISEETSRPLGEELKRKDLMIDNLRLDIELAEKMHQQKLEDLNAKLKQAIATHRIEMSQKSRDLNRLRDKLKEARRQYEDAQANVSRLKAKLSSPAIGLRGGDMPSSLPFDKDIELSNLRAEVAALRNSIAAKESAYPGLEFVHHNLFMAPLVRAPRADPMPGWRRERHRKATTPVAGANSDADTSQSEYGQADSSTEDTTSTRSEKRERKFDVMLGLPKNPIATLVNGKLAYRDGTRDAKGRLPRAKTTYRVGRDVPGELR